MNTFLYKMEITDETQVPSDRSPGPVSTDSAPCLNQGEQLLYVLQDCSEYVCLYTHNTVTLDTSFWNLLFKKQLSDLSCSFCVSMYRSVDF